MEGAEGEAPSAGQAQDERQDAPERKCIVAALSVICVVASVAKSANWNSSIGRWPFTASPMA